MNSMNLEELQVVAPAAFSDQAAPHVSDRYTHVRTADIVERMLDAGFTIRTASQQATQKRTAGNEGFQKHRISLRMPTDTDQLQMKVGNVFPTVDLINSGNWSSPFIMCSGLYRLVCENGMISPFGQANDTIRIRHDRIDESTEEAIQQAMAKAPKLAQFADDCASLKLSDAQVRQFAKDASRLRFNISEEETVDESIIQGMLSTRRIADDHNDLWTVFNRLQENGTRGGFRAPDTNGRLRRVRERKNIIADVNWNQGLWSLTEQMLANPPSIN